MALQNNVSMKVLIYFNGFTSVIGGSEFLPLTLAQEFQRRGHEVTFALGYDSDLALAQRQYGVSLDLAKLGVIVLKPKTRLEKLMNRLFRCAHEWKLQRVARQFDLCISTVNPIDFGKPAVHFIYMLGFTTGFRKELGWAEPPVGRNTPLHRLWRSVSAWVAQHFIVRVRTGDEILSDSRERVYPNSEWARQKIEFFFHCQTRECFYPPTLSEAGGSSVMRENVVVSIGRIDAIKRLEVQIEIVEKARQYTGVDLKFKIAGYIKDDAYGRQLRQLAAARPWIQLLGPVYGKDKESLLSSAKWAVHARCGEEFGISVVEYLKHGLIPIVPNAGGAAEVVAHSMLQYGGVDEAAQKLSQLLRDETLYKVMLKHCLSRAQYFSAMNYLDRQRQLVDSILEEMGG